MTKALKYLIPIVFLASIVTMAFDCHHKPLPQVESVKTRAIFLFLHPDEETTDVLSYAPDTPESFQTLFTFKHSQAAAKARLLPKQDGQPVTLVVNGIFDENSRYTEENGALERINASGAQILAQGVAIPSTPLILDERHIALEQIRPGTKPKSPFGMLRDNLSIVVVDSSTLTSRTVWHGLGEYAYLATQTGPDTFLLYHVDNGGGFLRQINWKTGRELFAIGPILATARDFTFDRTTNTVFYSFLMPDRPTLLMSLQMRPDAIPMEVSSTREDVRGGVSPDTRWLIKEVSTQNDIHYEVVDQRNHTSHKLNAPGRWLTFVGFTEE